MAIKIIDKFQPLFKAEEDVRYYLLTGGRGSSKSFSVSVMLLNLTYQPKEVILFTRYTMLSAHTSIIPEFIEKIDEMGVHNDFRITKDEIINLKTGSKVLFKGIKTASGNQTAALKSLTGVTTFVVDEAEEFDNEEEFDKIDLSVRVNGKHNKVILILNPTTKAHWIFEKFFERVNVEEGINGKVGNVRYIHTTYKDNIKNLSQSFLTSVLRMKKENPVKYEHVMLGGWLDKAEGVILTNWKTGKFRQSNLTAYGQDFGFSNDPSTLVKVSIDQITKQIFVREVYGKPALTTSDIAYRNIKECGINIVVCDGSEPRLIKELKSYGLNIKTAKRIKGSILTGIGLLQDYQIIVHPESKGIIRELNNYAWAEKGLKPIDKYNHFIDAIRYAVEYLLRNKRSGKYHIL